MRSFLCRMMSAQRWMIAVAIVAILLGIKLEMDRQSRHFTRLARQHARLADEHWHTLLALGGDPASLDGDPHTGLVPLRDVRHAKAMWSYHMSLSWKYQRAALDPWLPVEPDPPEPR